MMTAFAKPDHVPEATGRPVREAETVFVIFSNSADIDAFQEAICKRFPRFAVQEDALAWQQPFYRFTSPTYPDADTGEMPGTVTLKDITDLERAVIEQLAAGKAEIKSAAAVFNTARRQTEGLE